MTPGQARVVIPGASLAEALAADGFVAPAGHQLVTLAERPDLVPALNAHNMAAWARFMLEDPVADRCWHILHGEYAAYQMLLLDAGGVIAAAANCAPLAWDGTDAGLPHGWDDQFLRSVADLESGATLDTLGALQIVVGAGRRGGGLSGAMVGAMRAQARLRGLRALIACVRPTLKERYPTTPLDRYAGWTTPDGLPFDPWVRLHVRLGGRVVRPVADSMVISGSVADWEGWTGMAFPETGSYVVPGGAATVTIDRDADSGLYLDPNLWIVHSVAGG